MILDQFAHAAARRGETRLSSVSDVGAGTAMRVVVVHAFPSLCSRCDKDDESSAA